MKLLDLTAEGFSIPDGAYSLHQAKRPHDTAIVTGLPASGKTCFLRLIAAVKEAIGPYGGPPDFGGLLRGGRSSGRVAVTWLFSRADAELAGVAAGEQTATVEVGPGGHTVTAGAGLRDAFAPLSKVAARFELFPANRSLDPPSWRFAHPPLSEAVEDGRRLGSDRDKYGALRRVLHDAALAQAGRLARALDGRGIALRNAQPDLLAPYKRAVATMLPDLRLVAVEPRDGRAEPVFVRRDGQHGSTFELSASEEQGVLFALAFAWLRLSGAVVLIDSPEVHLHGQAQADFFGRILRLGEDNQVIAATGSEAIVRSVPEAQVIDLSGGKGRAR